LCPNEKIQIHIPIIDNFCLTLLGLFYLRLDYGLGVKANKENLIWIEFDRKNNLSHADSLEIKKINNYKDKADKFQRESEILVPAFEILALISLGLTIYLRKKNI
jgi:hypothetical protein